MPVWKGLKSQVTYEDSLKAENLSYDFGLTYIV